MNTVQIDDLLSQHKELGNSFIGVFPCNQLKFKISKFPSSLVINTDPDWKEGEHWVCCYIDKKRNIQFFDSYGFPPIQDEILNFFKENGKNHKYNSEQLQGLSSSACGHYCIIYLIGRGRGKSMNDIVNVCKGTFPGENDKDIMNFVNKTFKVNSINIQSGKGVTCQCCKSYNMCCK